MTFFYKEGKDEFKAVKFAICRVTVDPQSIPSLELHFFKISVDIKMNRYLFIEINKEEVFIEYLFAKFELMEI